MMGRLRLSHGVAQCRTIRSGSALAGQVSHAVANCRTAARTILKPAELLGKPSDRRPGVARQCDAGATVRPLIRGRRQDCGWFFYLLPLRRGVLGEGVGGKLAPPAYPPNAIYVNSIGVSDWRWM